LNKKAVLSQGDRAMPRVSLALFSNIADFFAPTSSFSKHPYPTRIPSDDPLDRCFFAIK